uniref:Uncharacterized protein n=1 Tax=Scophthalmus maximus TaxID=52904 RepID=A0A8D2ZHB8_SCOMX
MLLNVPSCCCAGRHLLKHSSLCHDETCVYAGESQPAERAAPRLYERSLAALSLSRFHRTIKNPRICLRTKPAIQRLGSLCTSTLSCSCSPSLRSTSSPGNQWSHCTR